MANKRQCDEEKRCIICNKPFDYRYDMFGRGCLSNLYDQLGVSDSKFISNKEKHLVNAVAHKNSKYFLNKEKKEVVLKNYIALSYLNLIKLNFTEELKKKLKENMKNISIFNSLTNSMEPAYLLNDFYKLYNYYVDFDELINEYKKDLAEAKTEKDIDEIEDKKNLKKYEFIFNSDKEIVPLFHMAFYDMQYIFWETVIVGGYLLDKPLSGYLLRLSLNNKEEYNDDNPLIIEDEYFDKLIFGYDEFKKVINENLNGDEVDIKDKNVTFSSGDLLFAIHEAVLSIKGNKKENENWNLTVEIEDTYDYTNLKKLKEFKNAFGSKTKSIVASTLNNFAAISSSYGVIRPFKYILKVKNNNYNTKK